MTIDGRQIGGGHCFVIAEAGVNHNGDVQLAHRLVDLAADAGADAVKFQTFEPDLLVTADAPKAEYQIRNADRDESQLEMLRRLALPRAAYLELMRHAHDRGILFLSTAFDESSADFLNALGMAAFKIPSGEITNDALLRHVAGFGKPLLMSTGMASLDEVHAAVECARRVSASPLALFHCVSTYPADPADCNLRAMSTLRDTFGVPVGWSDHTEGVVISLAAAAVGAELLEKHITLDRSLPGPDHAASLEPNELHQLMRGIRDIEASLGDGIKAPRAAELEVAAVARRSLHAARDLRGGAALTADDLVARRPGSGMPPSALPRIVGRTLRRSLANGEILREEDLV